MFPTNTGSLVWLYSHVVTSFPSTVVPNFEVSTTGILDVISSSFTLVMNFLNAKSNLTNTNSS